MRNVIEQRIADAQRDYELCGSPRAAQTILSRLSELKTLRALLVEVEGEGDTYRHEDGQECHLYDGLWWHGSQGSETTFLECDRGPHLFASDARPTTASAESVHELYTAAIKAADDLRHVPPEAVARDLREALNSFRWCNR